VPGLRSEFPVKMDRMWAIFAQRPVARAVAIFAALNLLTVLLFTLLVPGRSQLRPDSIPLQNPQEVLWRVGLAALTYLVILWALRPGRRSWWETVALAIFGVGVVVWLTNYYMPFLALGIVPVVARYFLPLPWVLSLVIALAGLSGWWSVRQPLQLTLEVKLIQIPTRTETLSTRPVPANPTAQTSFWVFITVLYAGYSLFALELLVREAKARQALESTQRELEEASRQAGVLAERQRLAREIHDTLAQSFASVVVHLEAAEGALGSPAVVNHLNQARDTAREGLSEARRLVWALRPEILEGIPLPEALQQLLQRWQSSSSQEARFTLAGEPRPLHPEIELSLLRITQEALNNVRKHAQANLVHVTLSYLEGLVMLDVQDDGIGLGQRAGSGGGFGLRSIRERVEALGGEFTVESEPGRGTILAVSLPEFPLPKHRVGGSK
jgi:signal transduction histidine kinase